MRILFAIAAMAAILGFAQPAQARDWSVYGGLVGGYAWSESDVSIPAGPSSFSIDPDGWTGGVFGGFETRVGGSWTLGLEGDWKASGGDDTAPAGTGPGDTFNLDQNWTASVRGRVGYDITPDTQVYGTIGWGWADVDAQVVVNGSPTVSETLDGWSASVGAQHDYGERFFARAEYRYTDYDDSSFATAFASNADLTSHEVLVGVGMKFGV